MTGSEKSDMVEGKQVTPFPEEELMSVSPTLVVPRAIDWTGGLNQTWTSVSTFVPKLLVFLVVLFVGWIIAKVVSKAVGMLLGKVGFDNLLAKAGAGDMQARSGIDPASIITKLVYYFILLIALQMALSAFGPSNPVSQTVDKIVAWLPKAVVAVVIVIITMAVANAVKDLMRGFLGGTSYGDLLTKIVGVFIVALGVIAALNQIGVATTVTEPVLDAVLFAVAGVIVVGVGGGLIKPMQTRWEGWLNNIQAESQRVKATSTSTSTSAAHTAGYTTTGAHTTGTTGTTGTTPGTTAPRAPGAPGAPGSTY